MNVFSSTEYQKSVLGKLVEILDEIKRVGRHYEPLNSAVHVARNLRRVCSRRGTSQGPQPLGTKGKIYTEIGLNYVN